MKNILAIVLFLLSGSIFGQDLIIEIVVSGSATGIPSTPKSLTNTISATLKNSDGSTVLSTNSYSSGTKYVVTTLISYTVASGLGWSGKVSATGSYTSNCLYPGDDTLIPGCVKNGSASVADYSVSFTGGTCYGVYFGSTTTNYTLSVNVNFYSLLNGVAPTVVPVLRDCAPTSLTLSIADSAPSFDWQRSEDDGSWTTFRTNAPATITATVSELSTTLSTRYNVRFVRAIGTDCGRKRISSSSLGFYFRAPSPTATFSKIDPTCHNGSNGSIQVTITSVNSTVINDFKVTIYDNPLDGLGTGYTIEDGFSISLTSLSSKTYRISVQNNSNTSTYGDCYTIYNDILLNNPTPVVATLSSPKFNGYEISCRGGSTGQISVNASGGAGGYGNYSWNTGATTQTITGLPAGNYSVTLTDKNGCSSNANTTIAEPPSPVSASIVSVNKPTFNGRDISCRDKADGLLRAVGSGGVGGYSYQWTSGPASADYPNAGVNSYVITVRDANNCPATQSYTVVNPAAIDFVLEQQAAITCAGSSTGALRLKDFSVINAIGDTDYLWSTRENTSYIDNKPTGTYALTVKDALGCSTTKSISLSDPPAYSASVVPDSDFNGSKISCNGGTDGVLRAVVLDHLGNPRIPNSYAWYHTSDLVTEIGSGPTKEDLNEGSYTLVVDYNSGCKAQSTFILNDPDPVSPLINPTSNYNGLVIKCAGESNGSIRAARNGGTGAHTYLWNDAGKTVGADLNGIGAGTYIVTATDANGCKGSTSFTVVDASPVTPSILPLSNYNGFVIKCFGESNGSLRASATGGTGGVDYTYAWDAGATGSDILALSAGTYTVTATDKNGCSGLKSMTIGQPEKVLATADVISDYNGFDISCAGASNGRLQVVPSGGTSSFTYLWSNGSTSINPSGLTKGTYSVTVTDTNGCTATASISLSEPDPVEVSIVEFSNFNGFGVSCKGNDNGYIKANATGGTETFSYEWLDKSETSNRLTNVGAGTYQVTVRDGNGCADSKSHLVTEPSSLTLSTSNKKHVKCFGASTGELEVMAAGGVANYAYSLDNVNWQPINQFSGLAAQSYTVYTRDLNLCVTSMVETLTEPSELIISFTDIEPAFCADPRGRAKADIVGGVGAYQYEWRNSSDIVISNTNTISNVAAGAYTLTSHDANDCIVLKTVAIVSTDGPQISVKENVAAKCSYSSDGSATLEVIEGDGPFTYQWPDGQATTMGSNLAKGTYLVEVKDRNNCVSTKEVAISAPDVLEIEKVESLSPACFGDCNGMIKVTNTGGTGTVAYNWGATVGDVLTGVCKGSYAVQATDANGCIANKSFIVSEPDPLEIKLTDRRLPKCHGGCDGMIAIEASGGNGGYQYEWNTGSELAIADGICAGSHTLSITDLKGCAIENTYSLGEPELLSIRLLDNEQPDCHDGCNGRLAVDAIGGVGTYNYQWSTGDSKAMTENICSGDYTITVADANACISYATYMVSNPPALIVDLGGSVTLCVGQTHVLNAGDMWYSYLWNSNTGLSSTQSSVTISKPGQYWVEVQNGMGCIAQDTFLLETSLDLLKASFLMPKEVLVGDTVAIIDVSWPLPDRIEWGLPTEMNKMMDLGDVIFGKFSAPGEYSVNLNTYLGECFDAIGKSITILENTRTNPMDDLGFQEFVKEFAMYPNPTQGNFSVKVELAETSPITLSVWSTLSGRLLKQVKLDGKENYDSDMIMESLIPGAYVLRLDHTKGKEYIRFIVH